MRVDIVGVAGGGREEKKCLHSLRKVWSQGGECVFLTVLNILDD